MSTWLLLAAQSRQFLTTTTNMSTVEEVVIVHLFRRSQKWSCCERGCTVNTLLSRNVPPVSYGRLAVGYTHLYDFKWYCCVSLVLFVSVSFQKTCNECRVQTEGRVCFGLCISIVFNS